LWHPPPSNYLIKIMSEMRPKNSFAISHRFHPQLLGPLCVLLTLSISGCAGVVSNSQPNPSPGAQLQVIPNYVDFKTVVIGQPNTQTLQLSNAGNEDLKITQIKITGNGLKLAPLALPMVLGSGQRQNITATFDPSAPGQVSGNLSITTNARDLMVNIPIAGDAKAAVAQVQANPTSLNFGNLAVHTANAKDVTLTNTGDVAVTVNGVMLSGAGFVISDLKPGFSLGPQQQVTFDISFTPATKGPVSGKLSLLLAKLPTVTISLSGDGTGSASLPSSHSVKLTWEASPSAKDGYRVYRAEISGGPYNLTSPSLVSNPTYVDAAVYAASTYYYVVTSVSHSGEESAFSNEVSVAIPAQ
jgi:hypothetical protein